MMMTPILIAGPRITPFGMPSRTVVVHSRVQVSCVIEEGDPPFRIRWFRDDRPLLVSSSVLSSPVARYPTATDPPLTVNIPAASSTGLRLTDFNAYSSILTIDQVLLHPCHHGSHHNSIHSMKKTIKGDGQSRRQLLLSGGKRGRRRPPFRSAPSQR